MTIYTSGFQVLGPLLIRLVGKQCELKNNLGVNQGEIDYGHLLIMGLGNFS